MTDLIELSTERLLPPSEALALLNGGAMDELSPLSSEPLSPIPETIVNASYFGVRYDSFGLLFNDDVNKELVDFVDLRTVPNGPSWLQGFTNIRGSITPVIDLKVVFNHAHDQVAKPAPKTQFSKNYLLAIGKGVASFALPLAQFPEKLSFDMAETRQDHELAPEILRPFIEHCFRQDIPWFCITQHEFLNHLKNRP
jgi:chemotaxis signal transduction protein